MNCRFANQKDYIFLNHSIAQKHIDFISYLQIKEDISFGRLIVCEDNSRIVGFCAIVPEPLYNYTAIKRLLIPNKKNLHKGYCSALLDFAEKQVEGEIGATPFDCNEGCRKIFENRGYIFRYQFGHYCYYSKKEG